MSQLDDAKEHIKKNKERMHNIKLINDNHIDFHDMVSAFVFKCENDDDFNEKVHMFLLHVMHESGDFVQFNYKNPNEIGVTLVKQLLKSIYIQDDEHETTH